MASIGEGVTDHREVSGVWFGQGRAPVIATQPGEVRTPEPLT